MSDSENIALCQLFEYWKDVLETRRKGWEATLKSPCLLDIIEMADSRKTSEDDDQKFCVFDIISSKFYREDYHSDIIAYLLNPQSPHGYGTLGISVFIEALNTARGFHLLMDNFRYAEVTREYPLPGGRVDILIKDETTKHVIVIENKMNRAWDMPRQIPRYCEHFSKEGYSVDAAVYLPLDKLSFPDKSTWLPQDEQWEKYLIVLPAYADTERTNLVNDWVEKMASAKVSGDCVAIFRQYATLIRKLSIKNMDKVTFDRFYDYLQQGENLETANSIYAMMSDLPKYLAQRIIDLYSSRCKPFKKIFPWAEHDAVFEQGYIDGIHCKIDIGCDIRFYKVVVCTPDETGYTDKCGRLPIKEFFRSKGVQLFDDYNEDSQFAISKLIPITTHIEPVLDGILKELRQVC